MAKARAIPDLSAEGTYSEAAAKVVAVRARELAEHASGVLDTSDIERLHDMRVATRRLRAALEVFEPCFPRKAHRRTLKEVKQLADGLGERRDRDVAIDALRGFSAQMPSADRPGIGTLVERLRQEQTEANERLAPLVSQERLAEIGEGLEALVASARAGAEEAR
jgi:CHAD domain-containing protein